MKASPSRPDYHPQEPLLYCFSGHRDFSKCTLQATEAHTIATALASDLRISPVEMLTLILSPMWEVRVIPELLRTTLQAGPVLNSSSQRDSSDPRASKAMGVWPVCARSVQCPRPQLAEFLSLLLVPHCVYSLARYTMCLSIRNILCYPVRAKTYTVPRCSRLSYWNTICLLCFLCDCPALASAAGCFDKTAHVFIIPHLYANTLSLLIVKWMTLSSRRQVLNPCLPFSPAPFPPSLSWTSA